MKRWNTCTCSTQLQHKQYMDAELNILPLPYIIIITLITVALDSFGIHVLFCVPTTPNNNYLNGSKI